MMTMTIVPRRVAPRVGETYQVLGEQVTFKAIAADTAGGYTLFELRTAPGAGSAPHRQHHEDEAFFVLEGTYSALIGEERVELGPGSYVFVPRGTVHAATNIGTGTARMLIMVTPGGNHERFLTEIGELVEDLSRCTPGLPISDSQIAIAAEKCGVEFFSEREVCLSAA
jgi:quercetin dioxygenase-like cupin family protein